MSRYKQVLEELRAFYTLTA